VQIEEAPLETDVGLHASEETAVTPAGGASASEKALETPLREAVTTAEALDETAAAVAVNPPLVAPPATVTEPGITRLPLLDVSATANPPEGAGAVRVTAQAEEAGVTSDAGVQLSALRAATTVGCVIAIEPPVPVADIEVPVSEAATGLEICTNVPEAAVVGETVNVALATTPFVIVLALSPVSRHR